MTETIQILVNLATVAAAIGAAWAAYESRRSANASRAAAEGQLVLQSIKDYFEPEMSDALRTVASWRDAHGEAFAPVWLDAFKRQDPAAVAVDKARRHVKAFFDRAVRLFEAKLVSGTAFREMAYTNGLNLYYDVVVPLEDELNPTRRKRTEEALKRELGRYEGGPPRA